MKSKFSCDFETTTTENDCRVWAWGASEIGNSSHFEYGNSIEDFIEWLKKQENSTCYFHNEKFDGEFIISYLLKNGYKWVAKKKFMTTKTFTTIIADTGQFYALQICFKKHGNNKVYCDIYDSLKLLPFSVDGLTIERIYSLLAFTESRRILFSSIWNRVSTFPVLFVTNSGCESINLSILFIKASKCCLVLTEFNTFSTVLSSGSALNSFLLKLPLSLSEFSLLLNSNVTLSALSISG